MHYMVQHLELMSTDAVNYCDVVNHQKETGCLYPKYNLTLIPAEKSGADLANCFNDVLKANEQFFQCTEMYFAIDKDAWIDIANFKSVLQQTIDKRLEEDKIKHLQKVYFF
jgi:hypothetical protein